MKSLAQNIVPLLKMAIDRCGNATELAKITGISNANISRWLKGDRDPRIGEFSPVLEYLGITMQLPGEEYYDFSYIPKVAAVAGAGASLETSDISGKAPADDTLTQLITGGIFAWAAYTLYKMFPRLKDVFIDTLFIGCIAFAAQFFRLFMQRFGAWLERPKHEVKDDEYASPEEKP